MLGFLVVGAGIARCVLSAEGVTSQSTDLDYTCKQLITHFVSAQYLALRLTVD